MKRIIISPKIRIDWHDFYFPIRVQCPRCHVIIGGEFWYYDENDLIRFYSNDNNGKVRCKICGQEFYPVDKNYVNKVSIFRSQDISYIDNIEDAEVRKKKDEFFKSKNANVVLL